MLRKFLFCGFFFNDTATTEIYTLSLHDALPILQRSLCRKVIFSAHTLARGLVVSSAPLDLAILPISSAGPPLHQVAQRRFPQVREILALFQARQHALQILLPGGALGQLFAHFPGGIGTSAQCAYCIRYRTLRSTISTIPMAEYTGNWLWPKEKSWKRTDFPAFCSGWASESGSECFSRRSRVRKRTRSSRTRRAKARSTSSSAAPNSRILRPGGSIKVRRPLAARRKP